VVVENKRGGGRFCGQGNGIIVYLYSTGKQEKMERTYLRKSLDYHTLIDDALISSQEII